MDPKFVSEVQKLLKQEYADSTQSTSSTYSKKYLPTIRYQDYRVPKKEPLETLKPFDRRKVLENKTEDSISDGSAEFRSVQELKGIREEYLNLQKLSQIARDQLKVKEEHLLSLQERVKGRVQGVKDEVKARGERQMIIRDVIDMKRKAKVLKLKINLSAKNNETLLAAQEVARQGYKDIEEKLRSTQDTRRLELIHQRDYLKLELEEFKEKAKTYRANIAKYEISKEQSTKLEELKKKEQTLKLDIKHLNEQMQDLVHKQKIEQDKIIAKYSEEIETLERNNKLLENEIEERRMEAATRNETVNQFMHHVNQVDYERFKENHDMHDNNSFKTVDGIGNKDYGFKNNNMDFVIKEFGSKELNDDNYSKEHSFNEFNQSSNAQYYNTEVSNKSINTNEENNTPFSNRSQETNMVFKKQQTVKTENNQILNKTRNPTELNHMDESEIYKLVNDKTIEVNGKVKSGHEYDTRKQVTVMRGLGNDNRNLTNDKTSRIGGGKIIMGTTDPRHIENVSIYGSKHWTSNQNTNIHNEMYQNNDHKKDYTEQREIQTLVTNNFTRETEHFRQRFDGTVKTINSESTCFQATGEDDKTENTNDLTIHHSSEREEFKKELRNIASNNTELQQYKFPIKSCELRAENDIQYQACRSENQSLESATTISKQLETRQKNDEVDSLNDPTEKEMILAEELGKVKVAQISNEDIKTVEPSEETVSNEQLDGLEVEKRNRVFVFKGKCNMNKTPEDLQDTRDVFKKPNLSHNTKKQPQQIKTRDQDMMDITRDESVGSVGRQGQNFRRDKQYGPRNQTCTTPTSERSQTPNRTTTPRLQQRNIQDWDTELQRNTEPHLQNIRYDTPRPDRKKIQLNIEPSGTNNRDRSATPSLERAQVINRQRTTREAASQSTRSTTPLGQINNTQKTYDTQSQIRDRYTTPTIGTPRTGRSYYQKDTNQQNANHSNLQRCDTPSLQTKYKQMTSTFDTRSSTPSMRRTQSPNSQRSFTPSLRNRSQTPRMSRANVATLQRSNSMACVPGRRLFEIESDENKTADSKNVVRNTAGDTTILNIEENIAVNSYNPAEQYTHKQQNEIMGEKYQHWKRNMNPMPTSGGDFSQQIPFGTRVNQETKREYYDHNKNNSKQRQQYPLLKQTIENDRDEALHKLENNTKPKYYQFRDTHMNTNNQWSSNTNQIPSNNDIVKENVRSNKHFTDGRFKITTQLSFKLSNKIVPRELNSCKMVLKTAQGGTQIRGDSKGAIHLEETQGNQNKRASYENQGCKMVLKTAQGNGTKSTIHLRETYGDQNERQSQEATDRKMILKTQGSKHPKVITEGAAYQESTYRNQYENQIDETTDGMYERRNHDNQFTMQNYENLIDKNDRDCFENTIHRKMETTPIGRVVKRGINNSAEQVRIRDVPDGINEHTLNQTKKVERNGRDHIERKNNRQIEAVQQDYEHTDKYEDTGQRNRREINNTNDRAFYERANIQKKDDQALDSIKTDSKVLNITDENNSVFHRRTNENIENSAQIQEQDMGNDQMKTNLKQKQAFNKIDNQTLTSKEQVFTNKDKQTLANQDTVKEDKTSAKANTNAIEEKLNRFLLNETHSMSNILNKPKQILLKKKTPTVVKKTKNVQFNVQLTKVYEMMPGQDILKRKGEHGELNEGKTPKKRKSRKLFNIDDD